MQHDRAKAVQTWHVSAWLLSQVVTLAQGDCLPPTGMHLERDHLFEAELSPLHQETALGSFGEAVPVGLVYCAQPALGEHMQTYWLNYFWREKRCEPLCPHFLMLQVATEKVVCVLVFMDQQVPDVMQE